MIKILTYINTAALVVAVAGGTFLYTQRTKITNQIVDQALTVVKGAMPEMPKMPQTTGPVNPFAK
tara:strand:- start:81 stop:275 length:195 start_codon:yes stop_codon:yes gene_type:complete